MLPGRERTRISPHSDISYEAFRCNNGMHLRVLYGQHLLMCEAHRHQSMNPVYVYHQPVISIDFFHSITKLFSSSHTNTLGFYVVIPQHIREGLYFLHLRSNLVHITKCVTIMIRMETSARAEV